MALVLAMTASAQSCDLSTTMINQDPYPAIPGENVKVVFQIDGVETDVCGQVKVSVIEEYPFSLDPSSQKTITVQSGTFVSNFNTFLLAPFTLRVDGNAVEGENTLKLEVYNSDTQSARIYDFVIEVEDVMTEFDVFIRNYDSATKTVTFDVVNVGKNEIDALTIRVPTQENVASGGGKTNVIGLLDSGEDISSTFNNLELNEGEIEVLLSYNDETGTRREVTKTVDFNPDFYAQNTTDEGRPLSFYLLWILIIGIVVYWLYNRRKRRKNSK